MPPGGFVYGGKLFEGCTKKPWRLINLLWKKRGRWSNFSSLADANADEPVWDHAVDVSPKVVGSARKQANKFFSKNAIPFRVETKEDRYVRLAPISSTEDAD